MCSKECANNKIHKNFECNAFRQNNFKVNADLFNYESSEVIYSIISPIRTLLTKKLRPELWPLIWMQMSHLSQRQESDFWKGKSEKIIGKF